jgi:hypothetical protein
LRRGIHNGFDIRHEPIVRHAFVIEGRQEQGPGKPKPGRVPGKRDRIGNGGGPGAHHQAIHRQSRIPISRHQGQALIERERSSLARGAEHVEPVAAVGEQVTRERG